MFKKTALFWKVGFPYSTHSLAHCHFSVQLPRDSWPVSGDDSRGASHLPSSHHHQLQVQTWRQRVGNFYNLNRNCLTPTACLSSSFYHCKMIIISILSTACSSVNFLVYYMASGRALSSLIPSVRRRSRWCYSYNSIYKGSFHNTYHFAYMKWSDVFLIDIFLIYTYSLC